MLTTTQTLPTTEQPPTPTFVSHAYNAELLSGLAAVSVTAPNDASTPVLHAVRISARQAVSSDRMLATRLIIDESATDEDGVLVPAPALRWLQKQTLRQLDTAAAEIVVHFTNHAILIVGDGTVIAELDFEPITGFFPPIERLFAPDGLIPDEATASSYSAETLNLLAKIGRAIAPPRKPQGPITFTTTTWPGGLSASRARVVVTFADQPGLNVLAMQTLAPR